MLLIFLISFVDLLQVHDSDNDYGGELTNEDFINANDVQFQRGSFGVEVNDDIDALFEGDIILNEIDVDGVFDDVTSKAGAKWPKVDELVNIPYTFPSTATKQDKADIARVVEEFRTKTCIR